MKKLLLIVFITILYFSAFSQGKLERYSCKTPVVTITYSGVAYNGYNYNWIVYYSVNTFNCRWLYSGVVAGYYNSTPDYYYLTPYFLENIGNSLSFTANSDGNNTAGPNQVPFYARAYVVTDDGIFYSDNAYLSTGGNIPTLATTSVSSIGTSYAYSGGVISSDGGSAISAKGVVWGYDSSVSTSNYVGITSNGSGTSSYSSYLSGLSQGTNYYVRAYATNSIGTGYGSALPFTTQQSVTVPNVTTAAIYSISSISAYSGGSVSYSGEGSITERGVCWNTVGSPNTNNSKTSNGSGTGSFTSFIENLTPSTTYYVRAYAKACGIVDGFNVCATGYGEELSFTTTSTGNVPAIYYAIDGNTITDSGITASGIALSDNGSAITAKGVCWSTSYNPTISDSHTNDGSGTASFASVITGLTCGATYHLRMYATNAIGTGYSSDYEFTPSSSNLPLLALKDFLTTQSCGSGNFYYSFSEACIALHKYNNDGYSCGTTSLSGSTFRTLGVVGSYIYRQFETCIVETVYTGHFLGINPLSGNYEVYYIANGIIQSITPCP